MARVSSRPGGEEQGSFTQEQAPEYIAKASEDFIEVMVIVANVSNGSVY